MTIQFGNREQRSFDERKKILARSGDRCARCGKKLSVYTVTMDHFIPFSKGGPDTLENLVPLCEECNIIKNDVVVNPYDYYHFLPKEDCAKLYELQEKYTVKTRWWGPRNFTKEDSVVIKYSSISNVFLGHNTKKYCRGVPMKGVLKKCTYDDLDEVYEFALKYYKKVGLPADDLKDTIMWLFQTRAIYKVMKASNLVAIIPFGIGVNKSSGGKKGYVFAINGIPCVYQKQDNKDLIKSCIRYIIEEVAMLHPQHAILSCFEVPKNDDFANSIASSFGDFRYEDGGFNVYLIRIIFEDDKEEKERLSNGEPRRSHMDRIEEGYSDFIRETFKIRSADKYGKEKKAKTQKKREKRRREYDEYDLEYYQSC